MPHALIDSQLLGPLTDGRAGPEATKAPLRSGIARFSAWVKRSGKGLVVRLRRQGNKTGTDYTDYHFNIAELADSPITELPTLSLNSATELAAAHAFTAGYLYTPIELHGRSGGLLTELQSNEVHELPTIHRLPELDTGCPKETVSSEDCTRSGTATGIETSESLAQGPSRACSFVRKSGEEEALSPSSTSRSIFSSRAASSRITRARLRRGNQ